MNRTRNKSARHAGLVATLAWTWATAGWPTQAEASSAALASFEIFSHHPGVLADRPWGPVETGASLPWKEDAKALFYLRPAGSAWLQTPAGELAQGLKSEEVPGLDLSGEMTVDDARLAALLEPILPALSFRLLRLEGTQVTDKSAALLKRLSGLRVLSLSGAISDQGLAALRATHIETLRIPKGPITAAGISTLAGQKSLRRLDLSEAAASASALKALAGLPLDQLTLGPSIDDAALAAACGIRTLGQLDISRAQVSETAFTTLPRLTKLHTLLLPKGTRDSGLGSIGKIRTLRRLDLSGAPVTDKGLAALSGLSNLEELSLAETAITDAGVDTLLRFTKLRVLDLTGTRLTRAGLQKLSALKNLQTLAFSSTGEMRLADLKAYGTLKRLRTLMVNGRPVSFAVVAYAKASGISGPDSAYALGKKAQAPWPEGTMVESLPTQPLQERRYPVLAGLMRIHQVESELDHVMPAVETARIDVQEDTQENFLGEFEVNAAPSKPKIRTGD